MNERIQNLYTGIMNATRVPGEIDKLKADAAELKREAKAYLSAQMTLQVISTLAMVGMFWLALKESNRRKG
jgi:hypothetical protein